MKKRDLILIVAILAIGLLSWGALELAKEEGAYVVVTVAGEEVARYSLAEDGEYELNGGTNILKIENGEAYMVWANCPTLGKTRCTHQGKISRTTEKITCRINKLVVTVYGAEDPDVELIG
ncbi:MAG: NusG domain II-containing protein [Clostridia bacterium]|nr:NusG domain II-containing protein [Clostridia bacterium]